MNEQDVTQAADRAAASEWQPRIVAFLCSWCAYTAADLAGVGRVPYDAGVRIVQVTCSGRVDAQFVMGALAAGADGVLIGGCHPGDCHFVDGNVKALRRFRLIRRVLQQLGIEDARVRLEWIAASETARLRAVLDDMAAQVRGLGPLDLPATRSAADREIGVHALAGGPAKEMAGA